MVKETEFLDDVDGSQVYENPGIRKGDEILLCRRSHGAERGARG